MIGGGGLLIRQSGAALEEFADYWVNAYAPSRLRVIVLFGYNVYQNR